MTNINATLTALRAAGIAQEHIDAVGAVALERANLVNALRVIERKLDTLTACTTLHGDDKTSRLAFEVACTAHKASQEALAKALELVQFAVTKDADNNGGKVDRQAIIEICRDTLAGVGL